MKYSPTLSLSPSMGERLEWGCCSGMGERSLVGGASLIPFGEASPAPPTLPFPHRGGRV